MIESEVMKPRVEVKEKFESFGLFGCGPCPSAQAFDVVAYHSVSVIEAEQGVKATGFEFALADDAATSTLVATANLALKKLKCGSHSMTMV